MDAQELACSGNKKCRTSSVRVVFTGGSIFITTVNTYSIYVYYGAAGQRWITVSRRVLLRTHGRNIYVYQFHWGLTAIQI